jgi:hypothetical protein
LIVSQGNEALESQTNFNDSKESKRGASQRI